MSRASAGQMPATPRARAGKSLLQNPPEAGHVRQSEHAFTKLRRTPMEAPPCMSEE